MELIRLSANRSLALGFSMIISVILQVVGDVGGGGGGLNGGGRGERGGGVTGSEGQDSCVQGSCYSPL